MRRPKLRLAGAYIVRSIDGRSSLDAPKRGTPSRIVTDDDRAIVRALLAARTRVRGKVTG